MIQQKSLVPENLLPESDLVDHSPLNFLETAVSHKIYLKLGIFLSLGAAIHIPGLHQPAQAREGINFKLQNRSTTKNEQLSSIRQQNKIDTFLPRILKLINIPGKLAANSSQGLDHIPTTSVIAPTNQPINRVKIVANREESYQATNTESSVRSEPLIHLVQKGDTINKIAQKYQVSKDELVQLNRIKNSNIIFVNQRLTIPPRTTNQALLNSNEQPESILASTDVSQGSHQQAIEGQNAASLEQKTTPDNLNLSKLNQEKINRAASEDDPYIARLRAEIELLRLQSKQQKSEIDPEIDSSSTSSTLLPESNSKKSYQLESDPTKTSRATVKPNSPQPKYNLQPDLLEEDVLALRLPPLPDSGEYLPSAFDGYIWPAQGVLTSPYGWRWGRMHQGIDIAAPFGTPIVAAASGEVISVGWLSGYGNLVKLKHLDGSITLYAHNNRNLVSHGQKVAQGEQIAEMGSTGHSTGPHLHFEIHSPNQEILNPLALLSKR